MKNNPHFQNNLIVSIVVGVLSLIGIGVVFANKPEPVAPPPPEVVPPVTVALPGGLVTKAKKLPASENGQGQGAAFGGNSGVSSANGAGAPAAGSGGPRLKGLGSN